jgi:hypothetical protein
VRRGRACLMGATNGRNGIRYCRHRSANRRTLLAAAGGPVWVVSLPDNDRIQNASPSSIRSLEAAMPLPLTGPTTRKVLTPSTGNLKAGSVAKRLRVCETSCLYCKWCMISNTSGRASQLAASRFSCYSAGMRLMRSRRFKEGCRPASENVAQRLSVMRNRKPYKQEIVKACGTVG